MKYGKELENLLPERDGKGFDTEFRGLYSVYRGCVVVILTSSN